MLRKVIQWLFFVILIELTIGGGGRLTAVGPVSLRMVLFVLAIALTVLYGIRERSSIQDFPITILLIFSFMLIAGVVTGIVNNADKTFLWEDIKPLFYFFLLPFFLIAIQTKEDINSVGNVIVIGSSVLAIGYLMLLLLIHTNALPFLTFYHLVNATNEFFFRGELAFFYKGFVFLCVGFLFSHLFYKSPNYYLLAILAIAIALTFTRGFLVALALTYLIYFFAIKRSYVKAMAGMLVCAVVVFFGKDVYSCIGSALSQATTIVNTNSPHRQNLLGNREWSDNQRVAQVQQVFDSVTPASFFVGHGFGNGIPLRPVHMEISYLEIFHKQGLLGLACWGCVLAFFTRSFREAYHIEQHYSVVFFLATLFILFQSLTNQYINNPIGIGVLLLSLGSFQAIKKICNEKSLRKHGNV